eukprot:7457117-Lingulodinium_polyedra.AAC.1
MFPLVAVSKRQTCVSVSAPEAELVAGSHGFLRVNWSLPWTCAIRFSPKSTQRCFTKTTVQ